MTYLVLRKTYVTNANSTTAKNTAIHENANKMTGNTEITDNIITKHTNQTSIFDLYTTFILL